MYGLPKDLEYEANHAIDMKKVESRVHQILSMRDPQVETTTSKLWNRNIIGLSGGIGIEKELNTLGHHTHDIIFEAARLKKINFPFANPGHKAKEYGNEGLDYLQKSMSRDIGDLAQRIRNDEDVRKYSRHAQNFVNRINRKTFT